jgi:hypothetical protein
MSFHSQMANDWKTTYYDHEEGFPKVLHAALSNLVFRVARST